MFLNEANRCEQSKHEEVPQYVMFVLVQYVCTYMLSGMLLILCALHRYF